MLKQAETAKLSSQVSENNFMELANKMSNLAWMADADGWIYWYNDRWYEYTGTTPEDMKGWGWQSIHDPKELPHVLEKWQASIRTGESFDMVFPLKGADGKFSSFLTRIEPVKTKEGSVAHWFGTNTNVDSILQTSARKDELELTTIELRAQQRHLIEINKTKDDFISLASHQLRTPATSVKQYVGMMLEGYAGEITSAQRDFLARAYNSNERQLKIIDDLLKVALIDAGKVSPHFSKVPLAPLIRDVLDTQASTFSEKEQDVIFINDNGQCAIEGDPSLIRMVIENVTDNASKYTHPGKKIIVELLKGSHSVKINVADQGVGIPEDERKKLFQKFSRIHNELSVEVGGSGLGLYWVKEILDLHRGSIGVKPNKGCGSIFTITLPA